MASDGEWVRYYGSTIPCLAIATHGQLVVGSLKIEDSQLQVAEISRAIVFQVGDFPVALISISIAH